MPVIEELPVTASDRSSRWKYVVQPRKRRVGQAGSIDNSSVNYDTAGPGATTPTTGLAGGASGGGSGMLASPLAGGSPSMSMGGIIGGQSGGPVIGSTGVATGSGGVVQGRVRAAKRQIANTSSAVLEEQQASRTLLDVTRRLGTLEKENMKDVQIPIPVIKSVRKKTKYNPSSTPAVRKILQSQKTFTNHLNDEEAMIMLHQNQSIYAPSSAHVATPATVTASGPAATSKKRAGCTAAAPAKAMPDSKDPGTRIEEGEDGDNDSDDSARGSGHHNDSALPFPLSVPILANPKPELLDAVLFSTPPLSYLGARAKSSDGSIGAAARADFGVSAPTPPRQFCQYCGYWGRIRCLQCGSRSCGLGCKRLHDGFCMKRYL